MDGNSIEESEIEGIKLNIEENQKLRGFFNKIFHCQDNIDYLLRNGTANRIEVAIDTIDDTFWGIKEFVSNPMGRSYLSLYGIFQLLICQQDSLYYLNCLVNEKVPSKKIPQSYFTDNEKNIRKIRNQIIGHPQETHSVKSGQVIRASMQRYTLTMVTTNIGKSSHHYQDISILDLIEIQLLDTKGKLVSAQDVMKMNQNIMFT
ncbi:hypothetical protein SCN93_01625 [Legionella pneumophila serogroup 1]